MANDLATLEDVNVLPSPETLEVTKITLPLFFSTPFKRKLKLDLKILNASDIGVLLVLSITNLLFDFSLGILPIIGADINDSTSFLDFIFVLSISLRYITEKGTKMLNIKDSK